MVRANSLSNSLATTVEPASAEPISVGVVSLVIKSIADNPVSVSNRLSKRLGADVSMRTVAVAARAERLPATS